MALIYSASTDALSSPNTSRIIGPFVRWLLPDASEETVNGIVFVVRKIAHVVEYAILSVLLWWALARPNLEKDGRWPGVSACFSFLIAVAYAVTDEFHQSFIPSRGASWWDVGLDSIGAFLGLVAVWLLGKWSRRW